VSPELRRFPFPQMLQHPLFHRDAALICAALFRGAISKSEALQPRPASVPAPTNRHDRLVGDPRSFSAKDRSLSKTLRRAARRGVFPL